MTELLDTVAVATATAGELLVGGDVVRRIEVPADVIDPVGQDGAIGAREIEIRPLTLRDVQMITRAAKDDDVLASILMIQRALVTPQMKRDEIASMHSGLVSFIVDAINRLSGLSASDDDFRALSESPVGRAFFTLAKEFSWTPDQVRALTLGEVLGYLHMLSSREAAP